jgi:hypothetical protein
VLTKKTVGLQDFGVWLLAALRLRGNRIFDVREEEALNEAFVQAYKVINRELDKKLVRFVIILDPIYRRSGRVNELMNYWLMSGYATRDDPGSIWRVQMNLNEAEKLLGEEVLGGRDLWLEAADTFLKRLCP